MIFGHYNSLGRGVAIGDPVHRAGDPQILLGVVHLLGQVKGPDAETFIETVIADQTRLETTERAPVGHTQLGLGTGDIPNAQLIQVAEEIRTITPSSDTGRGEAGSHRRLIERFITELPIDVNANLRSIVSCCDVRPCVQRQRTVI